MIKNIGVCSWSLQPESPAELVTSIQQVNVDCVQLALDPVRTGKWSLEETQILLDDAGICIRSGMMGMRGEDYSTLETIKNTGGVRLDQYWQENLAAAAENARIASELGIQLVTFHAGFIPNETSDPLLATMLERLRLVIDKFSEFKIKVAFETGQENADTLIEALQQLDRPGVGVNFDPANMILYAMGDPVQSLKKLVLYVAQIHIKDALPAKVPGTWGEEVVTGTGAVNWQAFFDVINNDMLSGCDLMIEREAGSNRIADIIQARELIEKYNR